MRPFKGMFQLEHAQIRDSDSLVWGGQAEVGGLLLLIDNVVEGNSSFVWSVRIDNFSYLT